MESLVLKWLSSNIENCLNSNPGDGSGSGSGCGNSYGSGYGCGSGSGNGMSCNRNCNGYGCGYGSGCGSVNGKGSCFKLNFNPDHNSWNNYNIKIFNGYTVFCIDDIPTIITNIKGDIAKGYILQNDLILKECYIAKGEGLFAHGNTIHEAVTALQDKLALELSPKDRIKMFLSEHNLKDRYPASDLFSWHYRLTGSCKAGREAFCHDKNIDLETASYTVYEFVNITKNAYGGDIIRMLEQEIRINNI